ncbi:hypothetical protein EW146_g86 [Bondarzewia mesenterica]|uniref:Protein kinase domain-containing protein n=1 Tax=Bondarzewia mesenterica TaxID=1095465 RepID=A0A4S4M8A4_9AGAM|nr:hypothetical protein EW146_g86 [Bondarzewia mesenterica]
MSIWTPTTPREGWTLAKSRPSTFRAIYLGSPYTVWFKALCAEDSEDNQPRPPPQRKPSPARAAQCAAMIDWRGMNPNIRAEDIKEDDESDAASHVVKAAYNVLYRTQGNYEFMNGKPIKEIKELKYLGSGAMSSAYIKSGVVITRNDSGEVKHEIVYVSKTWKLSMQSQWSGFHSELALYKSSHYLLPLQGDCVPRIMGVYTRPGQVNIIMEPPHPIFWIEASPTMPHVLKHLVVEAFAKIHARGIVHSDIALRHMLIGGDLKVTIIDFQASRAVVPNEAVGLGEAYESETRLEMRHVKFLLDYKGARQKELNKTRRALARLKRNALRKQMRSKKDAKDAEVSSDEEEPSDDDWDPPIFPEDMKTDWMVGANNVPRRFVMPGVHKEQLQKATVTFLDDVRRCDICLDELERPSPPTSPTRPAPAPAPAPSAPPRPRPILASQINPNPLPESTKVRDFAYEKYDGPKGYTVKRPLSVREIDVMQEYYNKILFARYKERPGVLARFSKAVKEKRQRQEAKRGGTQTREPKILVTGVATPAKGAGTRKRQLEDVDDPYAIDSRAAVKKAKYFSRRDKTDGKPRPADATSSDEDLHEQPGVPEGPPILTNAEYASEQAVRGPTIGRVTHSRRETGETSCGRGGPSSEAHLTMSTGLGSPQAKTNGTRVDSVKVGAIDNNGSIGKRKWVEERTASDAHVEEENAEATVGRKRQKFTALQGPRDVLEVKSPKVFLTRVPSKNDSVESTGLPDTRVNLPTLSSDKRPRIRQRSGHGPVELTVPGPAKLAPALRTTSRPRKAGLGRADSSHATARQPATTLVSRASPQRFLTSEDEVEAMLFAD